MQVTAVDQDCNLFLIEDIFPQTLVQAIVDTPWLDLPWQRQEGQELWPRRRIIDSALPWISQWNQCCEELWPAIARAIGHEMVNYQGTAWWVDEPGFTCSMHTDGEMPGAMQITWIGDSDLGTEFYHYKNVDFLRYKFKAKANQGYIMINRSDPTEFRKLQWHAMLTPVQHYRVSSYSWITTL
jgi:hypothetical protein